jgi:lysophospholipase L1-like esterase
MILGDSIAVGTAPYKPQCAVYAKGGINSWQYNKTFYNKDGAEEVATAIISLGSNDHKGVKTYEELKTLRMRIMAKKVYWIMPAIKPEVQDHVKLIANYYNDTIITIPYLQKDGIHPSDRGYKSISQAIK